MMSDRDLVHSSAIIATGCVEAIGTVADALDHMETRVQVRTEEQLKGEYRPVLTFVLPGATRAGVRRVVFGAPQFHLGEQVVVFLRHRPDGALTPTGLAMGKFSVIASSAGVRVRRQLDVGHSRILAFDESSRQLIEKPGLEERALQPFLADVRRMRAEAPGEDDPSIPDPDAAPPSTHWGAAFAFEGAPPVRWIEPDHNDPITYLVDRAGDQWLGTAASQAAVAEALAAWGHAGAGVQLLDGGAAPPAPFNACDGLSSIQFNDPFGEIGPPNNCAGVLAVGGYCSSDTESSSMNGLSFERITEGDVTVNNGFARCRFWTAANLTEILTHELGHTLGLAHSSENPDESNPVLRDATMYYLAHFDGRGAALRADDTAGIQALYPISAPEPFVPLRIRAFSLDAAATTLVLNVAIRFPAGATFTPSRDRLTVSLSDSAGVRYTGTVRRFTWLGPQRTRAGYLGVIARRPDRTVALFRWLHGSNASLVIRATDPNLAVATGAQTFLTLTLGQQTFSVSVPLQPSGDRIWVLQ